MSVWTRTKPAEFADILAGLDRELGPDRNFPSDQNFLSDNEKEAPKGSRTSVGEAGLAGIAPETASRPRNRLTQVLANLAWPWHKGGGARAAGAAATYAQEAAEPAPPRTEPEPSRDNPPKSEDEVIAGELGLTKSLAKADLARIRRDFAKSNHPDLCAPAQRVRAARRMSIANMLIDAQLKQGRKPQ